MAQFWGILGPNSSKYCLISIKFLPEVVLKDKKTLFGDSLENRNFTETGDTQSLHFEPNLPSKDGRNRGK